MSPTVAVTEIGILRIVGKTKIHTIAPLAVDKGWLIGVVITMMVCPANPVVRVGGNSDASAGV